MDDTPSMNKYRRMMDEEYEKKYELYLAMLKDKGVRDLFVFNKHVLKAEEGDGNFVPLGEFHKELCHFVTDRTDRKKLILIPRSHLKTKLVTIGYCLQQIVKNPQIRILVYSATWQMAVDIQQGIQKALQSNEMIQQIWGDLSKDAKEWSQDRTRLAVNDKREPTVTAAGIDNNLVGGHYDIIIMDDVVNRDNIATLDQIEKVKKRYRDSLDLLEPSGQFIVIGTRWHDADLYGWILDPENGVNASYEVMIKGAFTGNISTGEDFVALWPGKFSLAELQKRLREEGWSHFSSQYMNDPVPEEDATFKRTWFRYYDSTDMQGRLMNKFMAVDPAISEAKEADYTAMMVVGVDEENFVYTLDIIRLRLSPNDIINEIFRLRDKWNLADIGIEQIAFQKTLAYSLRDDPRFKARPFHITELKPQERSKTERIKALQPLYENGKIYHNKLLANTLYLEDELVRFPRSTHDDIIDALSYCLDIIFPARQKTSGGRVKHKYLY